jgi:hypothetical protein
MTWRNRIVGTGEESPQDLVANPKNWRTHPVGQETALSAALDEVGWVDDVIVNRRSGLLVDGHLRTELAAKRGEQSIPVKYVDLDEREEALVLATFDPISGMAGTDEDKLKELMDSAGDFDFSDIHANEDDLSFDGDEDFDIEPQDPMDRITLLVPTANTKSAVRALRGFIGDFGGYILE